MIAVVHNRTRGDVVCEHTEIADTLWRRMRGLLGRSDLPVGSGMLIQRESSIHSAFMRFEFDAVFLDRNMRVVRLAERIRPWRALSAKGARSVLELPSGQISARALQVGDELAVEVVRGESPEPTSPA